MKQEWPKAQGLRRPNLIGRAMPDAGKRSRAYQDREFSLLCTAHSPISEKSSHCNFRIRYLIYNKPDCLIRMLHVMI
jgi:hypothetical protein